MDDREAWVRFAAAMLAKGSHPYDPSCGRPMWECAAVDASRGADALLDECRKRFGDGAPQGDETGALAFRQEDSNKLDDYGPGRCEVCGWTLSDGSCEPGSCSYRPASDSPEGRRIAMRRKALAARKPCATCHGHGRRVYAVIEGESETEDCPDCAGESGGDHAK